jgi:methylated-DNA-[protein]-cysteine S-methyltransferase
MGRVTITTPLGPVTLAAHSGRLTSLGFGGPRAEGEEPDPVLIEAARQIDGYFAQNLQIFDLPLGPAATGFQMRARAAMLAIPYGKTASYGQLAAKLGTAPRAVGLACARNPLPIIVPCHRVLGAAGSLGGYSGGAGLGTKRWLLAHEAGARAAA